MQKDFSFSVQLINLPVNFEGFDLSQKIAVSLLTVLFVAVAFSFVTVWLALEKRSRARRFCLFGCLWVFFQSCCGNLQVTFNGKRYLTDSLVASVTSSLVSIPIFWLLAYFYNFSEYQIILCGLMVTKGFLWLTTTVATGVPFTSIFIDLLTCIVLFVAVWNRKKYLSTYKIVFPCLISLSGLSPAAIIAQRQKILAIILALLIICSTVLVAIVGKHRVSRLRSKEPL